MQRAFEGRLGANPIAEGLNELGKITLVLLVLCLTCTPLKIVTGWNWPVRIRKTLGNYAFFYAAAHFLTYAGLDQVFDLSRILEDVTQRWFIIFGFAALVLMLPLAITSTKRMVARLGFRRWKLLHRLVYPATALAIAHLYLREKIDHGESLSYAAFVGVLLTVRVVAAVRTRSQL